MSIGDNSSFLNEVNITSKVRAPGEYKYYYCGENNSESDKSFLAVSSMWYTDKITKDMVILVSCYNSVNTAQLYLNVTTDKYNIFIYKNILDYRNENISLKLVQIIHMNPCKEMLNLKNDIDKINIRMFFASDDYILINEVDYKISMIDINNGELNTIYDKATDEGEPIYNLIDTYDEFYISESRRKIRTYVFLSTKYQERKTPTYSCRYFIIQRGALAKTTFDLHTIDFDLGFAEPHGVKIGKIIKQIDGDLKHLYILIYISSQIIFQLITDYDNLSLHQMLKKNSRTIEEMVNNESNNNNNNTNSNVFKGSDEKNKLYVNKVGIEHENKQFCHCAKISLNINNKKICAFTIFVEVNGIITYNFNYTDSPYEIKNKIFINSKNKMNFDIKTVESNFSKPAKIYKLIDRYQFTSKCNIGYTGNNLIVFERNRFQINDEKNEESIYYYEFYEEILSLLMNFDGYGCTFLLTNTKLFKLIHNSRYDLFSHKSIFEDNKIRIHEYKLSNNFNFPIFEYCPEDIWNAYCSSLGIETINVSTHKRNSECDIIDDEKSKLSLQSSLRGSNFKDNVLRKSSTMTSSVIDEGHFCVLCNKKCELCCSACKMRYYCSQAHFIYDFYTYHFFECQLFQFFKRKDIFSIENEEIRYKVLYNELIKMCGRILHFIFKRIYCNKDYQFFLQMILTLINIMDNFGFNYNLEEFCPVFFKSGKDTKKSEHEKVIFYQEALYYYTQMNLLKCTFALKSGLHNLADCYLKIVKNEIIPKYSKSNQRMVYKKNEPKRNIIYDNEYFTQFDSELFFDIKKFEKNIGSKSDIIDVLENYIIQHLMYSSLLIKFKIKINSSIDVQNTFIDIYLLFYDHYIDSHEYSVIISYCYFATTFYLVEIGKVAQAMKLLRRMVNNLNQETDSKLYALTYYNLGILQFAIGYFDLGIHNIEIAYKIILDKSFSEKLKFRVIDSLGLAYLNKGNLFKAFLLIQTSIKERKKFKRRKDEISCNKLNVYLNYIVDLYEYTFISKTRLLIKKKYPNYDKRKLLRFVLGEDDKEQVISEQSINQFIKVVEFIWKLPDSVLKQLNIDNPPKAATNFFREEQHFDKGNLSFNSDVSQTSTFIYKGDLNDKDELIDEYEEDIEVKTNLYDNLLTRQQQQEFKELKNIFFKRDIILRDTLGNIEKFNINYDPVFALEFQKIIEKLKIHFLLKEIFYCFQNEKWRDELYNYNHNNILFGLSKYLKLEKIKNMMTIEKSKNFEMAKRQREKKINDSSNNNLINANLEINETSENESSNKNINNNNFYDDNDDYSDDFFDDVSKDEKINNSSNSSQKIMNTNRKNNNDLEYQEFKNRFFKSLKEKEKDKKNQDLYDFLSLDEDYLYSLYKSVYLNNPDHDFIFQNPLLILNYIFVEINKTDNKNSKSKSKRENNLNAKLNFSKIKEEKNKSYVSSDSNSNSEYSSSTVKKSLKDNKSILKSNTDKVSESESNNLIKTNKKPQKNLVNKKKSNCSNGIESGEESSGESDSESESESSSSEESLSNSEKSNTNSEQQVNKLTERYMQKLSKYDYSLDNISIISKETEYSYIYYKKELQEKKEKFDYALFYKKAKSINRVFGDSRKRFNKSSPFFILDKNKRMGSFKGLKLIKKNEDNKNFWDDAEKVLKLNKERNLSDEKIKMIKKIKKIGEGENLKSIFRGWKKMIAQTTRKNEDENSSIEKKKLTVKEKSSKNLNQKIIVGIKSNKDNGKNENDNSGINKHTKHDSLLSFINKVNNNDNAKKNFKQNELSNLKKNLLLNLNKKTHVKKTINNSKSKPKTNRDNSNKENRYHIHEINIFNFKNSPKPKKQLAKNYSVPKYNARYYDLDSKLKEDINKELENSQINYLQNKYKNNQSKTNRNNLLNNNNYNDHKKSGIKKKQHNKNPNKINSSTTTINSSLSCINFAANDEIKKISKKKSNKNFKFYDEDESESYSERQYNLCNYHKATNSLTKKYICNFKVNTSKDNKLSNVNYMPNKVIYKKFLLSTGRITTNDNTSSNTNRVLSSKRMRNAEKNNINNSYFKIFTNRQISKILK